MIRKLIARFNKSVSERRAAPRYDFQAPVKIWIQPPGKTGKLQTPAEPLCIYGETKDLSAAGIAFLVPSIRIRESYLVGENCLLNAELDLPAGRLRMQIIGQRYEQIGEHLSVSRYLIGASIEQMKAEDREIYEHFLLYGRKNSGKIVSMEVETAKEAREVFETT